MDYVFLCKAFFAATNIPVYLLKNGDNVYSAPSEAIGISSEGHRELFDIDLAKNPCFCRDSPDIEYGRIKIEGTEYDLILGPIFNVPVTEELIRQYMKESALSLTLKEQIMEFFCSVPRISHTQFAEYLVFLHQCLNQKEIDSHQLFMEETAFNQERNSRYTHNIVEAHEEEILHNTYYFELELYERIKEGNIEKLSQFLSTSRISLQEGKMAQTPIRHAKNLFITAITKAGFLGAIPGGLDIERTYQLIDYYIQECEQLHTIERIHQLMYVMILDFCRRCGETRIPDGISPDVYQCMTYIRNHTNIPISIDSAAAQVNRSSSYMMKHFKSELGIHMGAYIMRCKLEEAKSLLTYSEKSLAEISSYLCFSSQSYFQNVFKKQYGVTPLQYRKQTKGRLN